MRRADPARSRAVLIGTSTYEADTTLPDLPAVASNLTDLAAALTDPDTLGLPAAHLTLIPEPVHATELARKVAEVARSAEDLLLVYYAGHGLLDERNELYLGLRRSTQREAHFDSLSFAWLRRAIADSPAGTIVVLIDSCFSGRALGGEMMADAATVAAGQIETTGMYTLTAAAADRPAQAPEGAVHTAFTGELINVLRQGTPLAGPMLTLDAIYRTLRERLPERPRAAGTDVVSDFGLCPNHAYRPGETVLEMPDDDELRQRYQHLVDRTLSSGARRTTAERLIQLGVPYVAEAAHYILTDYQLGEEDRRAATDALVGMESRFAEEAADYWRRQLGNGAITGRTGRISIAVRLGTLGPAYLREAATILRPIAKGLPDPDEPTLQERALAAQAMIQLGPDYRREGWVYAGVVGPKASGQWARERWATMRAGGGFTTFRPSPVDVTTYPPGHPMAEWWEGVSIPTSTAAEEASWWERARAAGGYGVLTMGDYWQRVYKFSNIGLNQVLKGVQASGSGHHYAMWLARLARQDHRMAVLYLASHTTLGMKRLRPALRCLVDEEPELTASLLRNVLAEFPRQAIKLCRVSGLPHPQLPSGEHD